MALTTLYGVCYCVEQSIMMGFIKMLGQAFLKGSQTPTEAVQDPAAWAFINDLVKRSDEPKLKEWIKLKEVYLYEDFHAWGYAWEGKYDAHPRLGLHRSLLERRHTPRAEFTGGHELGHILQFLNGKKEPPPCTRELFSLELDASRMGRRVLRAKSLRYFSSRYWYVSYHYVMAVKSTCGWIVHALAMLLLGGLGFVTWKLAIPKGEWGLKAFWTSPPSGADSKGSFH
jgi:hypothetical protein